MEIKQYTKERIPDVLRFERDLRSEENFWGWEIDEKYMVYMVDGARSAYDMDRLTRMYEYLNKGELYFIEILENERFKPIGDVTFWQDDMPIVIGDAHYRGKGIGRKVISALVQRGRSLGFGHVSVGEIYDWNEPSRRCCESVGFRAYEKTEKGSKYRLTFEKA